MPVKYIFVLGGGYSGLGKGVVTASIARLLQNFGKKVATIKIDPYFNFGAGDQNPNEHGEVFVTEDGGEIDQDFGHYERITGNPTKAFQNITSGKVFASVVEKSRLGKYLGKSVQVIPHVRDEHKAFIRKAAEGYEIAIVEVGGTVGDDEALFFTRAIASMLNDDNEEAAVALLVPIVFNEAVGEPKTKIAQNAVKDLGLFGMKTDFLITRVDYDDFMDDKRKAKLCTFCNIKKENIITDPNLDSIYRLPEVFGKQQLGEKISRQLNLTNGQPDWHGYDHFLSKLDAAQDRIPIAYVGKYVAEGKGIHKDAYISVEEALRRACIEFGFMPEIHRIDAVACEKDLSLLKKVAGVIVPGGYGCRGLEGKVSAIKYVRENKMPFLGLCLGLQMGVVEFARNVCGMIGAHGEEMDEGGACAGKEKHLICALPDQERLRQSQGYIGTQRLGDFACIIDKDSFVRKLYERVGRPDAYEQSKLKSYDLMRLGHLTPEDFVVFERHRHRYEVNPAFHAVLQEKGMTFPGVHKAMDGTLLVEMISVKDHPFYVATQAHPEFTSTYLRPNPLFLGFAEACKKNWKG